MLKYKTSHFKNSVLFLFAIFWFTQINAGKLQFEAGFRIPVTHSAGVEYWFNKWLSVSFHGNILTNPYKKAFIDILEINDKNKVLANTIGEAFSFGLELQPAVKYWYKNYYFSLYYSNFSLLAKDSPLNVIKNYYQVNIPDILYFTGSDISLNTTLNNIGISFGRLFNTKIPHLIIKTGLSLSKCFESHSKMDGMSLLTSILNHEIDRELSPYLVRSGYIPSINIYFVYEL